jgi:hypothetical protein
MRSQWLVVSFSAFILLAMTAHWGPVRMNDADAANWPSWWFVRHGTFFLDGFHSNNPWFIHANGHFVSNRTPGVILFGLPLQALFLRAYISANVVGSLTATLATAGALANVSVALRKLVGQRLALSATACLGFGTATWTVAGAELWPHTADLFWLSLAMLALTEQRVLLGGLAMSPLILTRPHLAFAIGVVGLWMGISQRSVRVLLCFAVPASVSVGLLVAWNALTFGSPSLWGGYAGHVDVLPGQGNVVWRYIVNIAGAVASPQRGLLLYTPLALFCVIWIAAGWRRAPVWLRAFLIGGLAYDAVQLRLNRYSGGYGFYSNRLLLESILMGAPLLVIGYQSWAENKPQRAVLARGLAALSIAIHSLGAFLPGAYYLHGQPWNTWGPVAAVRYETGAAIAIIVIAVIAGAVITVWPLRRGTAAATDPVHPPAAASAATPG